MISHRERILHLAERGVGCGEIAKRVGVSRQRVHQVIVGGGARAIWRFSVLRERIANRSDLHRRLVDEFDRRGWPADIAVNGSRVTINGTVVKLHEVCTEWRYGRNRYGGYYRVVTRATQPTIRIISTPSGWIWAYDPATTKKPQERYIDPRLMRQARPWWPTEADLDEVKGVTSMVFFNPFTRTETAHVMRRRGDARMERIAAVAVDRRAA